MSEDEPVSDPKIFGIGFQKTGTSSLKRALRQLGYRVATALGVHDPHIARDVYDLAFGQLDRYDAFQDNPWAILYKELDEWCPGSKFILTVRPVDKWLPSIVNHFGGTSSAMREWIYGVGDPIGNEEIFVQRYERHNAAVLEYFESRPQDLLIFRMGEGDGWPSLCRFLDQEIPSGDFPHANSRAKREAGKLIHRRVWRGARRQIHSFRAGLARRFLQPRTRAS
jgi:hypothetical protein